MAVTRKRVATRLPNVTRAVRLLIRDIARRLPEYRHIRADRILVIAGEARRASRATVRPLRFQENASLVAKDGARRKPSVRFKGHEVYYTITLRPLFFRASTPEQRIETILHELFHIAPDFDGTLDWNRRHAVLPKPEFERLFRPIVKRYLAQCPVLVLERLAINGDVLARQWLEKPSNVIGPHGKQRRRYRDEQTFLGPVRMITRTAKH